MQKSYSWDEIKELLLDLLSETKHIMTYGTIGSCNIDNDIDTIITKKPTSSTSDFFREVHTIFDKVDIYMQQKHNCRLICFSKFEHEEEVIFIANGIPEDLLFHVLIYVNLPQMKDHWAPNLVKGESVEPLIRQEYETISGSKEDLFSPAFRKESKYSSMILYAHDLDRFNSHFPQKLLIKKMNGLYHYVLRKRLKIDFEEPKTVEESKALFYFLFDSIDKLETMTP